MTPPRTRSRQARPASRHRKDPGFAAASRQRSRRHGQGHAGHALPRLLAMSRHTLAVLLCTLQACSVLPTRTPPAAELALPASWSGSEAATAGAAAVLSTPLADWWLRFDDPQLAALVRQALQANTRLLGAQAALQQAQALRDVAAAAMWPVVGASASAQRGSAEGHSTGNRLQAGLNASWAIDLFGGQRAALAAGEAGMAASQASLGDVQVQLAAEVAHSYLLLRSAQARLAITGQNLASQQEVLQLTLWRQQAGLPGALEAEQALAAVAQNQALLPVLASSIEQSRHALAVLTGQPPGALPALHDPRRAGVIPRLREPITPAMPADTLRQRADIRAAEYQVAAALARVGQAQALRWPDFAIGGSLGVEAATAGGLSHAGALLGSLLASITLPVFDGGALRAQVGVQQAALAQAQQAYRGAVLKALQEVEDVMTALRGDQLRLASLLQAADAAGRAARLARQRYDSGLIDFQNVQDTQRAQLAAQDSLASGQADVASDHIRLFTALGGGWRPVTPVSPP